MADVTIYHNPQCGSSKNAVAAARELGVEFDVVEYLKTPPDRETLERIVAVLEDPVADLVRKDSLFAKLELDADDYTEAGPVIDLLLERKALMQRPMIVTADRAIIGRPTSRCASCSPAEAVPSAGRSSGQARSVRSRASMRAERSMGEGWPPMARAAPPSPS